MNECMCERKGDCIDMQLLCGEGRRERKEKRRKGKRRRTPAHRDTGRARSAMRAPTASRHTLSAMGDRARARVLEKYRRVVDNWHRVGISVHAGYMLGFHRLEVSR